MDRVQMLVTIPKVLHQTAKVEAAKRGITLYQLVTESLQAYLSTHSDLVEKR
jgi:predicted HicB family RNase H-like nuclease